MADFFDVIVIGGGHAGAEAAWAASHMLGDRGGVAMVTMDPEAIGRMSCNPAIGGLAKGQMVREIDALGGLMGRAIDATGIQFRMLNRSKGPAVQSPRAQADKYRYARKVQEMLREHCGNLSIISGIVDRFETCEEGDAAGEGRKTIQGVVLQDGRRLGARAVVVTTGTFLRALMHTGERKTEGGRVGEQTARGLSGSLLEMGFELGRLKTGTPPRVAKESIDFGGLQEQPGDDPPTPFSDLTAAGAFPALQQVPMHITYTNNRVHEMIRANLHRAPMYSGQIHSRGPRYCPSIEDKVVRFADKDAHQVFLEPEGLETNEIYCNGISTSLPEDVQIEMIHSITGLEGAKVLRWGYAVEYDFSPTHQVDGTLETRRVSGLFFAGQLNGTSGYEEAAGQGIVAGINAARRVRGEGRFTLARDQAYIGVMIDDLITKTPTEPYRMFTSRAEFRLTLRSDNADQRLTPVGAALGLASSARTERLSRKLSDMAALTKALQSTRVRMEHNGITAYELLRRPDTSAQEVRQIALERGTPVGRFGDAVWGQVEIEAKYAGYIEREKQTAQRLRELEDKAIPQAFNFGGIRELRNEAKQALERFRPATVGQAGRLEGITPSDLTILMVHLRGKV
ncbi:MAG TPA: tRNA uridine-5-carboxymethylaminomethyl(34) synthesis enzyme MnmG [Phycisphaerae bacterium]|nr:tRNA uridine-5-carboxymethylaminomethyl(34) synthesis enzyme MnmG [Phycisphaerae bacterium]